MPITADCSPWGAAGSPGDPTTAKGSNARNQVALGWDRSPAKNKVPGQGQTKILGPSSMAHQHQNRGRGGGGRGGASAGAGSGSGCGRRGARRPSARRRSGCQHMKSFLDLETTPAASISSFSLAEARLHVDNDASFLLSPRSSVAASTNTTIMADTATEAAVVALAAVMTSNTTTTSPTTSCSSTAIVSPALSTASTDSRGGSSSRTASIAVGHRNRHLAQPNPRHQHQRRDQRLLDRQDDNGGGGGEYQARDELPLQNRRHRYQHSLRLLDNYLWSDQRPSSSPHHQSRSLSRSNSKSPVLQNAPKYIRTSSDEPLPVIDSMASSMTMTRDEFEALPPTIQRKYFSTLERLRFAQISDDFNNPGASFESSHRGSPSPSPREEDEIRPPRFRLGFSSDELDNAPHRRSQLDYKPVRVYSDSAEKLRIQRHRSCDQLASHSRHQSVILDATDEAYIRLGKRQSKPLSPDGSLDSRTILQPGARMHSSTSDQAKRSPDLKETAESIYDSFRWLEDDELDLRLYLDDYHINLREKMPAPSKHRRPSFRRHLSINKLPFGGRVSTTLSRPATKDAVLSPTFMSSPTSSVPGSPGHVRRRSRALSLISPNKQSLPDASTISAATDPAASHYQDPDARMKLRVYLASPHKFDEAIEFGFPSIDEVQGNENKAHKRLGSCQDTLKLRTFLEDDMFSMYSEASVADPESPRTPEAVEKQLPTRATRATRASQDSGATPKVDYAQAPASSREMTLRMTLTRPDLRAHEDQIYGWQKPSASRKSQTRDENLSPLPYARDGNSKESFERQFAAMDQEDLVHDGGVVRRFWNRVRRT